MISWQSGTVRKILDRTHRVKSFFLRLPDWDLFRPGQHIDVRLTAPDGYQAQGSYSIASAPEDGDEIELAIELIADGEVSPFFHDVVRIGDRIEVRGPIGGPFTWSATQGGPLLLVGGGSGIAPLMSMLRHQSLAAPETRTLLLYSSRSIDDVIYLEELDRLSKYRSEVSVVHTLTRRQPTGWDAYSRRVDEAMLGEVLDWLGQPSNAYVCGPTGFVEAVANALVALRIPPAMIRTERFGPTGS